MTSPVRTFLDLARELPIPDLVAAGDVVQRIWGASGDEMTYCLNRRLRYTGKVRARDTIPLLDPRAESPQESRTRAIIALNGLPVPTPQVVVRDRAGVVIARVDLAVEECRLVLEYDGQHHWSPAQYRRDAARRTALRTAGWTVLEITSPDLLLPHRNGTPPLVTKYRDALTLLDAWHLVGHLRRSTPRQGARHRDRGMGV